MTMTATDTCGRCLIQMCDGCVDFDRFADNSCDGERVMGEILADQRIAEMSQEEIDAAIHDFNIHEACSEY